MSFWNFIGLTSKQDIINQTDQIKSLNKILSDIKENQPNIRSDIEKSCSTYRQQQSDFMSEINKTYSVIVEELNSLKSGFMEQVTELKKQLNSNKSENSNAIKDLSLRLDKLEKHIDEVLNEQLTESIIKINEEFNSKITSELEMIEESTR